jgi:hypothetical protein
MMPRDNSNQREKSKEANLFRPAFIGMTLSVFLLLFLQSVSAATVLLKCEASRDSPFKIEKTGIDATTGEPAFKDSTEYGCTVVSHCTETYPNTEGLCSLVNKHTTFSVTKEQAPDSYWATYKVTATTSFECVSDPPTSPYTFTSDPPAEFTVKDCSLFGKAYDDAKIAADNICSGKTGGTAAEGENAGGEQAGTEGICVPEKNALDEENAKLASAQSAFEQLESTRKFKESVLKEKEASLAAYESEYATREDALYGAQQEYEDANKKYEQTVSNENVIWIRYLATAGGPVISFAANIFGVYYGGEPGELKGFATDVLAPEPFGGVVDLLIEDKLKAAQEQVQAAKRKKDLMWSVYDSEMALWREFSQRTNPDALKKDIQSLEAELDDLAHQSYDYESTKIPRLQTNVDHADVDYQTCLKEQGLEKQEKESKKACDDARAEEESAKGKYDACIASTE